MRDFCGSRAWAISGMFVAVLVLGACGGSASHAATVPSTTPGTGGAGARSDAFRACMSKQGITLSQRPRGANGTPPSTTPGATRPRDGNGPGFGNRFQNPPAGVDATAWQNALKACQSELPSGGNGFRNNSAFQAYASCLKDHGVTLPSQPGASPLDRTDPKVAAALKTCSPLRPSFGRGSPTTTVPTNA